MSATLEVYAERFRRSLLRTLVFEDSEMVLPHTLGEVRALYPDLPDDTRQEIVVMTLERLLRNKEIRLMWARFEDRLPVERELTTSEAAETVRQDWWRQYPPAHEDPSRLVLISPTSSGEAVGTAALLDPDLPTDP